MSIECTTSANNTVTCLYSADWLACVTGVPHSLQKLAVGLDSMPQEPQSSPVAVSPPPPSPLGSTSASFHRCSVMSVISLCHLRHEVLRPSYVAYYATTLLTIGGSPCRELTRLNTGCSPRDSQDLWFGVPGDLLITS
jgi:hypothetical protein